MIAKGTTVRQKVPVVEGVIDDAKLDTDSGKIQYHVTFTGPDGEPSARWFAEDELEVTEGNERQTIGAEDVGDASKVLGMGKRGAKS